MPSDDSQDLFRSPGGKIIHYRPDAKSPDWRPVVLVLDNKDVINPEGLCEFLVSTLNLFYLQSGVNPAAMTTKPVKRKVTTHKSFIIQDEQET